jgi:prepilin-type N-terminal cleavage/methylation domain-containing protein/prepilin-type processing-associated H-X9-DG protein
MRKAFTLVETLVVIAILGILLALALSGVQRVRAAASRNECLNRCRQVGLACQNYASQNQRFPIGVVTDSKVSTLLYSTWLTQLLPYVEQDAVYKRMQEDYRNNSNFGAPPHRGLDQVIPAFLCPADARVRQAKYSPSNKLTVAFTSYIGVCGESCYDTDGILFPNSKVTTQAIRDGLSNTLLFGERPPDNSYRYGWWYAGIGLGYTGAADAVLGVYERNPYGSICPFGQLEKVCDALHFWSLHEGGANFCFADGSSKFLPYSAAKVIVALSTIAGGETNLNYE